jgi:hypothetical protein
VNAYSINLSIPIKDSNAEVIYTLFGTGGSEHYLDSLFQVTEINYVGPLQLRLVEGTEDSEESLLGYDGSPTWHTRGQVHNDDLLGDRANSPEYGTLRRFRLRGMELTLKFTHIKTDKTGLLESFVLVILVKKCSNCTSKQAELPDYLKGKFDKIWRGKNGAWYHADEYDANFEPIPPPTIELETSNVQPVSKKPTDALIMANFHFKLEATTLAEIVDAIGIGNIQQQGDAGESIYWLCYTIHEPIGSSRLWLISHGEMGGSDHKLTKILVLSDSSVHACGSCPLLPKAFFPASLDNGLWLYQSDSVVASLFGSTHSLPSSHQQFVYRSLIPINVRGEIEDFDLTNYLRIRIENGKIIQLSASQVTSN